LIQLVDLSQNDSIKGLALPNIVCEVHSIMKVNTICLAEKNS